MLTKTRFHLIQTAHTCISKQIPFEDSGGSDHSTEQCTGEPAAEDILSAEIQPGDGRFRPELYSSPGTKPVHVMINPVDLPAGRRDVITVTQRASDIKEIHAVADLEKELASLLPDALTDTVFNLLVVVATLHNPLILPLFKPLENDEMTICFLGMTGNPQLSISLSKPNSTSHCHELQKRETKSSKLNSPSAEYTQEQLNYFKIAYIVTNVLAHGLRLIFKREWDYRYKATLGEWQDTPQNGLDFFNNESLRNQKRNARLLATMVNGNTAEWDCTMLFYAILHSDSITGLSTTVRQSVENLREFRSGEFAHNAQAKLSDPEFRIAIRKVEVSFKVLGLPTVEIHDVSEQRSFSTQELHNAMKEAQSIYQELQGTDVKLQMLEQQWQWQDWQQDDASSFCILPSKPPHEISSRLV
ncbi:hypothetical protein ACROYT_G020235 [Oculina patagonica]